MGKTSTETLSSWLKLDCGVAGGLAPGTTQATGDGLHTGSQGIVLSGLCLTLALISALPFLRAGLVLKFRGVAL